MQKCYLALGCFWKPEENFRTKPGILETEVGYAGGKVMNVTYEQVCRGDTEHAEVVKLTYDQKEISYINKKQCHKILLQKQHTNGTSLKTKMDQLSI